MNREDRLRNRDFGDLVLKCSVCGSVNLSKKHLTPSAYMSALSEDDPELYSQQRYCEDGCGWMKPTEVANAQAAHS